MRTIKFRAWDNSLYLDEPEMYDWGKINELDTEGIMHLCDIIMYKEKDVTPMQFTGLVDKNGVEIYEGDIITMSSGIFKKTPMRVLFCETLLCYVLTFDGISKSKELKVTSTKRLTVIGNIHQHPELLK